MRRWTGAVATGLLLMLILAARVVAQTGGVFDLSWSTIDNGGGTTAGGTFSVEGTVGQADAGALSGGSFTLAGGFWPAAGAPTPTPTPTPYPRPNVGVQVAPGGGTLQTTIAARDAACPGGNNKLQSLQFTRLTNATVTVATAPVTTVSTTPSTVALPGNPATIGLTVHRVAVGQAATVELVVTDGCGTWPTIVGGGPGAF